MRIRDEGSIADYIKQMKMCYNELKKYQAFMNSFIERNKRYSEDFIELLIHNYPDGDEHAEEREDNINENVTTHLPNNHGREIKSRFYEENEIRELDKMTQKPSVTSSLSCVNMLLKNYN
ncbi:hypothetical protein HELRODRAFT_168413 [Helobdella robusta]|uniref:Uncharacterized protein n=1 Tax=Helobdella robusta TaxID=6412 RepID=T1F0K2_HELRO|nr:hypothetical protein HELRODRAFT_168413 [Helobdella robusta]ESO09430.1 hypothetical protein HELRODRAFT_168413 [Helobdella robusta]